MHRTDNKEKKTKKEINKLYSETSYNTMIRRGPSEVAKSVFREPPYYLRFLGGKK